MTLPPVTIRTVRAIVATAAGLALGHFLGAWVFFVALGVLSVWLLWPWRPWRGSR